MQSWQLVEGSTDMNPGLLAACQTTSSAPPPSVLGFPILTKHTSDLSSHHLSKLFPCMAFSFYFFLPVDYSVDFSTSLPT